MICDIVNVEAERIADLGFVTNDHRMNVALTRAREVLWVVGGSLQGRLIETKSMKEYKRNPDEAIKPNNLSLVLAVKESLAARKAIYTLKVLSRKKLIRL